MMHNRRAQGGRPPPTLYPGQSLHPSPGQATARRPIGSGTTTARHRSAFPQRPVCPTLPTVPTHQAPYQGTLHLGGRTGRAAGQQRRNTEFAPPGHQPQGQRRHPVATGQQQQDDPGLLVRYLARPQYEPHRRLPPTPIFPSTLNCYLQPHLHILRTRERRTSPCPEP